MMTVGALLHTLLPHASFPDRAVERLTDDSRQASEKALFVCIRGAHSDGHLYAEAAYGQGCRLFLAEDPLTLPEDAFVYYVDDTRRALGVLASLFYGTPSKELRVIGVTGTKGKTTVALLLSRILNQNDIPCGYIGTNGIAYGAHTAPTRNTTPDAITLQETLAGMKTAGMRAVILEVSSQSLMQHRVDGVAFSAAIFSNLSPDHIGANEHASYEEYAAWKKTLFTDYGIETAFINTDDPFGRSLAFETTATQCVTCSSEHSETDYFVSELQRDFQGGLPCVRATLHGAGSEAALTLPLIGAINAMNALQAAAAAQRLFGIALSDAAKALETVRIDGRSESIALPTGGLVVIDYAHNEISLRLLLSELRLYAPMRLITLFGSVGERTQMRRALLGHVAGELSDLCIITSDNPGCEDPDAIMQEISSAVSAHNTPFVTLADREAAIRYGLSILKPGDILILAGKGHEEYQLVNGKKEYFSERAILNAYLEEIGSLV